MQEPMQQTVIRSVHYFLLSYFLQYYGYLLPEGPYVRATPEHMQGISYYCMTSWTCCCLHIKIFIELIWGDFWSISTFSGRSDSSFSEAITRSLSLRWSFFSKLKSVPIESIFTSRASLEAVIACIISTRVGVVLPVSFLNSTHSSLSSV